MFIAFDYGQKRIGVAVGDAITACARPLPTLASSTQPDWPGIQRLLVEWRPQALVVGLPLNDDGTEQPISLEARRFAEQLRQRSQLPVHLADERYSSRAADDALRDARSSGRMSRRVRKGDRDGEAARVILEQWLADPAGGHSIPLRSSGL